MKVTFWGLFVIGLGLCTSLGIGKTLERAGGSWASPAMIAGTVLGVAILALALSFGTGVRPLLKTDLSMVVTLVALMGAKVGVSAVHAALATLR